MKSIVASRFVKDITVFLIVFVIGLSSSYLLLTHFRHTIFNKSQAFSVNQQQDLFSVANDIYGESEAKPAPTTGGCGCPGCCAVSELL